MGVCALQPSPEWSRDRRSYTSTPPARTASSIFPSIRQKYPLHYHLPRPSICLRSSRSSSTFPSSSSGTEIRFVVF